MRLRQHCGRSSPTGSSPNATRVLAIPLKRIDRALIIYLTEPEVETLPAACDLATWTGRRDHALPLWAVQTGQRVSELTGLTCTDLHLDVAGGPPPCADHPARTSHATAKAAKTGSPR